MLFFIDSLYVQPHNNNAIMQYSMNGGVSVEHWNLNIQATILFIIYLLITYSN